MTTMAVKPPRTAVHRPATRKRRNRHDEYVAVDLFSGFGGLTRGIAQAGFTTIMAANHNAYKVEVHEANHPEAEHWIADLVDPDSSDYHSARDLPAADLLVAGVSCVNHSQANSEKAYATGKTLFDLDDPDFDERVTKSERDRATANCVLHYAETHHPLMILVECTTQLTSWGPAVDGKRKVGDGSTYRWWLKQFANLGYKHRVLYLNSRFFDVDQSRDRAYWVFWDEKLPTPDLEHRPLTWCGNCSDVVEAAWTWKTGIPPTGKVAYGEQYNYRCPRCRQEIVPPSGYALRSLDLTDLGPTLGERKTPLAASTMARAARCKERFAEFPAVVMPAKALGRGTEKHPWQPLATQTSQQEAALLSTGAVMVAAGHTHERPGSDCRTRDFTQPLWTQPATNTTGLITPPVALAVDNFQGAPRPADEALPTQGGSETMALVSSGVMPFRKHTIPTMHAEPMPTQTAEQVPGLLTAAGMVQNNGSIDEAKYRSRPMDRPLGTVVGSAVQQGMLFSGWYKQNGGGAADTAAHGADEPLGTLTSRDTTAMLHAQWVEALEDLKLEDCHFRMMKEHEIGRGCGFDVDFLDHKGTFKVWGSARNQVDGFGNAVSPQVGEWIGTALRKVLHGTH